MKRIDITGVIGWEFTAEDLRRLLGSDNEDVLINVYSGGGSVFEGLEMYNIISDYKGKVTVRLGAFAASAATIFPCAADHVIARKNTMAVIHKPWSFAVGNSDDMKEMFDILSGMDKIFVSTYVEKTGKKKEEILADMTSEKWLFGGEDIVAYGLADEVTDDISDLPEAENEKTKEDAETIIIEIQNKLKDQSITAEQKERIAAMIPHKKNIFAAISSKLEKPKQQNPGVAGLDNLTMEVDMNNLSEFLEKNPEAKAEMETSIINAKADGKKEALAEAKAEKEKAVALAVDNTLKIVSASGVKLNPEAEKAAKEMQSAGDYALEVLKVGQSKTPGDNTKIIGGASAAHQPSEDAKGDPEYAKGKVGLDKLFEKEAK